jgi:hypothetical protein
MGSVPSWLTPRSWALFGPMWPASPTVMSIPFLECEGVVAAIKVPELIALCSTLIALGALILTAYLARMTLRHQQTEAHRDRVWERKTDALGPLTP